MENEDNRSADAENESVEDFKEEVEQDPSTASPSEDDDSDVGRLRGG